MATATRFAAAAAALCALAPHSAFASDTQVWPTTNVSVGLGDGFKVSNETVFRIGDAKGLYEIENNLMIGKALDKNVTVWLGYTHDPNYLQGSFRVMEHRFRQQVDIDHFLMIGKAKLGGRVRLEERWREGASGTGWRLRPLVKLTVPVTNRKGTALVFSHESFIDLNTTSFQLKGGIERMRNLV